MADNTIFKYVSLANLQKYDEKIKEHIAAADATLKTNLEGQVGVVAGALDGEIARAKAAEQANAAAAKKAQDEVDALELVVAGKAAQTDLDALAGKVGDVPADQTVMGIIQNIQENAYDDTELKTEINAELAKKADKTQVATDIAAAVKVETDARVEAVAGVQGAVDALSGTHATDKKALEDAIALKADITALNAVSDVANAAVKQADYDVKVKALEDEDARIAGLVSAEATKAREEEGKLDARLVEVETFFKTAEGETIDQAMDTLVEIQKYITEDGAAADQMVKDIAANKKAIEDHVATDHDFAAADATLKAELNGEIAKKADASVVEGIDGRVEVLEGKAEDLEGRMDTAEYDIDALQAKFGEGEGSVADMIADAVKVETDARVEAVAGVQADADKGIEDAAAALAAANSASTHADELNEAMNLRVVELEKVDHEHANKALLDTYTQTEENLADAVAKKHTHANATVLDGISAEKVTAWDDASGKAHVHSNMDVLEAITAAKVAAWDAAEQAAKTYADGLNTAMDARMVAVETWQANMVECSQEDINALFQQ